MTTTQNNNHMTRGRSAFAAGAIALVLGLLSSCGSDTSDAATVTTEPPSSDAAVSFAAPTDGDHIAGSVHLQMNATGVTIEPAGEVHPNAGHFHVIADDGCVTAGQGVPKDLDHVHFGKGQTEGDIYLAAGQHTLCLQIGDGTHLAQPLTTEVTVDVGVDSPEEWCAVSQQIETLTDEASMEAVSTADQFAEFQQIYAKAMRLEDQLQEGIDQVDAEHRPAIADFLGFFASLGGVIVDAPTATEANATAEELFTAPPASFEKAAAWMMDVCKVDVNT